ncbi:glycosyltransferase family 2 protein [Williamsia sp. 1135]|uniref:glycosyltransferase family 2 protein n=1 Tax=Williamsia sp. 1135 TaxID=1889262 RepID=UPI0011815C72|nr:glycosyltransferase family 2 protein [Williamsia sp. 1135]
MVAPRISVIVPAFNENETIRDCLQSLLDQIDDLKEVIAVDNNSTDGTDEIIEEFVSRSPKFTLLRVTRQGLVPARNAGFAAARGDILARIDADTRVCAGWADAVADFFDKHGAAIAGATGLCSLYDAPFQEGYRRKHREVTATLRDNAGGPTDYGRLFGSNMAVTATAWDKIRDRTSDRDDVFEDLDIALCLREAGFRTALMPGADAQISGRRYLVGPVAHLRYLICDQRTYQVHGMQKERLSAILKMFVVDIPFYASMFLPFRLYDLEQGKFSLSAFNRVRRLKVRAHS